MWDARATTAGPVPSGPGLRTQILLALVAVLAMAGSLAALAIGPLTLGAQRGTRQRSAMILARSVAGQTQQVRTHEEVVALLDGAVGEGAFAAVALLDGSGRRVARAGGFEHPFPVPPFMDEMRVVDERLELVVAIPAGGALVAEVSLERTRRERAVLVGIGLYTAMASILALGVIFILLTRYTVRPIEALTDAAERTAAGRRTLIAPTEGAAEVVRASQAFNSMIQQLAAREADLETRVDELERATRDLRSAQDNLVRTERLASVGRLAAGLAHEIGNPLAAIVGLTEVLRGGGLGDAEVEDFAGRIGREAERIHRTIREVLDYARTGPADGAADDIGCDPREGVEQVERLLAPQKAMRGIRLEKEIAMDAPRARIGPDKFAQVLLNLVLNAADALRSASPAVAEGVIRVRVVRGAGGVAVDVTDNGPGVPLEARQRIFEPFFTTKPAGEGTGLGLAICASIVEAAGGTIAVGEREDGQPGARFMLKLPEFRSS